MIAPQILVVASVLSLTWGIFLVASVRDYRTLLRRQTRRRSEVIVAFRRVLVTFCLWLICFSYVFRTGVVLAGMGEEAAAQITFFALLGSNVVGSIYAIISLRYD